MNDTARQAFVALGRLKFGAELEAIVKLLPPKEQARVGVVMATLAEFSDEELARHLLTTLESDHNVERPYEHS